MPEAAFWDNFFSHVDVIKVRLVTDFLTAQEAARTAAEAKHERWVQLFDAMEPEMRQDVRRAAERIAARQQPPQLSDLEHQLGLDAHRSARWVPESVDASLEYVEDGPHEVAKVLRAALVTRGQLADEPNHTPNRLAPGELPMWRSPDDVGNDAADGDGGTVEEDFVYESGAPKRAQVPKGMEGGGSKAVAAAVSGGARAAGA